MKTRKIEHIGIAVSDLNQAIAFYEEILGLECYGIEEVADQNPEGPIGRFIEKRGPGIHHMAFAVDNVSEALKEAAGKGVRLIDESPRQGAEGLQIGFLHPKSTMGVLTELCGDE